MFLIDHLLWLWLGAASLMSVAWALAHLRGNAGWVDVIWAGAMAAVALYAGSVGDGALLPRMLVAMMGGLWGARLCLHLLHRVLHDPEDERYRQLRIRWHDAPSRFFLLFQARALLLALLATPLLLAASNPDPGFGLFTAVALLLWGVGVGGEALADHQLRRFRAVPGNLHRVCRRGLWAWSRHPNYFFECIHWCSYPLLAWNAPYGWLALLGPLLMLLVVTRISGIRPTEAQSLRRRGRAYHRYRCEVAALIPWPPRSGAHDAPAAAGPRGR